MSFPTVQFEVDAGVAWVTLNRPEVLNAYNVQMRDDLFQVFSAIREDEDIRAMVLRGAGRAFCAGADLTEFGTAPSPTIARRVRFARDVWAELRSIPVPKIAVMHGFVFGSGLELALFCDLRIAAEGTLFGLPEVRLGMIPAAGGTQTLPRATGLGAALDLLLTGRRIDAREALRLRLVSRVVAAEGLTGAAVALARQLANTDPAAVRAIRRAVVEGSELPLDAGLQLEERLAIGLVRAGI